MAADSNAESLISGGNATVFVENMDRAFRFYTETLGLRPLYRAGDHFAMLDAGQGFQIGLHPPADNAGPPGANGATQIGLSVSQSIEKVVQALVERGVEFTAQPDSTSFVRDDGAVKLAFFTDPDGNTLYLCEQVQ